MLVFTQILPLYLCYVPNHEIRQENIGPLYKQSNQSIHELIKFQSSNTNKLYEASQVRYNILRNIGIGLVLVSITLALWLGFTLIRAIVRPLEAAII
jgi:uncharacterized membrane protein YukC